MEQARSRQGPRHQPRHALPQDRGVRSRAGRRGAEPARPPSRRASDVALRTNWRTLSQAQYSDHGLSSAAMSRRCADALATPCGPALRRRSHPRRRGAFRLFDATRTVRPAAAVRVLLVLSVVTSAFKVNLPLAKSGSTMSVSYAVDFTALILLGPHETMLVAVASAWSQCTFRMQERNPLPPYALQHGVPRDHGAGGRLCRTAGSAERLAKLASTLAAIAGPLVGRRHRLLHRQHVADRRGHRAVDGRTGPRGLEPELPVERAELLRRRRRRVGRRLGAPRLRHLDRAAALRAALPHLLHL